MKQLTLALLIGLISNSALASDPPQISVQGSCEMNVVPDRGRITFSVEHQSKDQKSAVSKTNDQINKLKTELEKLKLKNFEMKNTNYSVHPVREYEKDRYVDKGVRAALTLELTTSEIPRIGETLAIASKFGVQNVGALETYLSTESSQKEYLKCLDIASLDARSKADRLAAKLGFKIGAVINVNEVPNLQSPESPPRTMFKASAESFTQGTQIEAGTQKFSTNIQVTFSIK